MKQLIFGIHTVLGALDSDVIIKKIYVAGNKRHSRVDTILNLAKQSNIPVHTVALQELSQLLKTDKHQGVAAEIIEETSLTVQDVRSLFERHQQNSLFLILDSITDPHNVGAILRTAEAFGVSGVIVAKDKACSLTPVVRKVASGAAERLPFLQVTNLARTIDELKALGVWVTGTALESHSQSIYDFQFSGPIALVMGAEAKGIRRLIQEKCDYLVQIPMQGQMQSLNVSVATGICLYEITRSRIHL